MALQSSNLVTGTIWPVFELLTRLNNTLTDLDVATVANDIPEQPDDNRLDANHSSAKDSPLSVVIACVSVNTCLAITCVFT